MFLGAAIQKLSDGRYKCVVAVYISIVIYISVYIGKKIKLSYTNSTVEIYYKFKRIAFHKRDKKKFGYTTIKEHMPPNHRFVKNWNTESGVTGKQFTRPIGLTKNYLTSEK